MTDKLDIAYLAIGADFAWRAEVDTKGDARPDCFDGMGQDHVISEVIACASQLSKAWRDMDGSNTWHGGVWYYDVSEALGDWIIRDWIANASKPNEKQIAEKIQALILESLHQ